jgi:hypothetical protein
MSYQIQSQSLKTKISVRHQPSSAMKIIFFLSIIFLTLICQTYRLEAQTMSEQQQLTGHENHKVTLSYAASLTKNFRLMTHATSTTVLGEYFGKDALIATLNQDNCIGLRIYYGTKNDGTPALVLVGVNTSGNDMTSGWVLEDGYLCPPICDFRNSMMDNEPSTGLSELNSSPDRNKNQ